MQKPLGTTAPTAETDWRAVAIVVAAGVIVALQVGKGIITLPALRADFSLDLAAAGWIISVFALVGVVSGIPAGVAVNRFGDRFLCILGLAVLACGGLAGALASSFAMLLAGRIVEGVGFLVTVVAAPALLQRTVAAGDRDFVFGLWSTFMPAGMAIALLCGAWVEGWRGFWIANGALTAAAALLVMLMVPRKKAEAGSIATGALARDAWTTLTASGPLLLAFTFALYSLLYFALAGFLPILLTERMGVSPVAAGVLSAIVVAANIVGNLAAGILLGRGITARWSLIAIAAIVMGLSGVAIFLAPLPAAIIFLLCVIFSGIGGLLPATLLTSAPLLVPMPRLAPMSLGLVMQGSNLGQVVGPVTIGAAVDWAGWPAAAWPVAIAATVAAVMAGLVRRFPLMRRGHS
ncbi:MFS transporter [Taklimakanibacter lacteus]|uniref:MFS transporter n=1 Tax=Taklimakanibacter lacteus TaxID=2268456 RepID=UPI000E66F336